MKKLLPAILLVFLFSVSSVAQCPFSLGPDVTLCPGNSIVLQGSGGLTYTWSTGEVTQSIIVSTPGVYWLSIFDGTSTCSDTMVVFFNPALNISLTCINNSCTQCIDGSITANVSSGAPPYSYVWSNGASGASITNLAAGTYTITVTGANGCTASSSCQITTGPVGTGPHLVSGNVFFDSDSNGIKGPGENGVPFIKVTLSPDGLTSFTDTAGNYAFLTDSGAHVIDYVPSPGLTLTSAAGSYNVQVTSGSYPGYDFGVKGTVSGGFAISYLNGGNPRCSNTVPYMVFCNAYVTASSLQGTIRVIIDSATAYMTSNPLASSVSADTITWNFTVNAGISQLQYSCYLQIPAQAGYAFNTYAETILQDSAGNIVFSSADTLQQVIACSFDPNDKSVTPEGFGPQHYVFIDLTPALDYTIRFQNTGNDTAYNVVILDTLDQAFDLSTFVFGGSSHPVNITLLNNVAEFRFDNIFLPDSNVNEPESHGFVRFSCNPQYQGTAYPLENNAAIYFDSNTPVITNTTFSTVEVTVGIQQLPKDDMHAVIYPNPFTNEATLQFENPERVIKQLSIFDVSGRTISTENSSAAAFRIKAADLNSGVYFFRLTDTQNGRSTWGRFIITR
jgi:hypothetical protein